MDVGLFGRPHSLGNVAPVLGSQTGLEDFFAWMRNNFDPTVTWKDLEWVRERWTRPIILKGILDAEDAREALRIGVDGISVSNHGGRQLDGAQSPAGALAAFVEGVGDRLTALADGGVQSGLDVLRLVALGARGGGLIGRAWVYALAARGGAGVSHVLDLLAAEMKVAMALTGNTDVKTIRSDTLLH